MSLKGYWKQLAIDRHDDWRDAKARIIHADEKSIKMTINGEKLDYVPGTGTFQFKVSAIKVPKHNNANPPGGSITLTLTTKKNKVSK